MFSRNDKVVLAEGRYVPGVDRGEEYTVTDYDDMTGTMCIVIPGEKEITNVPSECFLLTMGSPLLPDMEEPTALANSGPRERKEVEENEKLTERTYEEFSTLKDVLLPPELPLRKSGFTRKELFALHDQLCSNCKQIMVLKNHDYTADTDVFANFKNSEMFGVDNGIGLLLRVNDKMMRLRTYLEKGELAVEGEGFEDAAMDIINYMVLLVGMKREESRK